MTVAVSRVALVTGGAGGIGSATCSLFAERGYRVALADLNIAVAEQAASEIDPSGTRVRPLMVDVSSGESVDTMVDGAIAAFGGIDVLVNMAGTTRPGPSESVSDSEWAALLDIHLGGTFRCSRAAFPALRQSEAGAIVNTASVAAWLGLPGRASYCAAKAGIEGLTKTLAVEWAKHGIRVNAIAPGYIRTLPVGRLIERGIIPEDRLRARIPLDRLGRPEEIASAIHFLASPDASYLTGHTLTVDGGLTVSGDF